MVTVSTLFTGEQGLLYAIVGRDMTTFRARLRGVPGVDRDDLPAPPKLLVLQHAAEGPPALIENRLVQPGFGSNILAWLVYRPPCRPGHIAYPQVFQNDHRVVFADVGRKFVQKVVALVGNT